MAEERGDLHRASGHSRVSLSQGEAINEILHSLERSKGPRDPSWKKLLAWLGKKDEETAAKTCKMKGGDNGRTLLHVACSKHAPAKVVKKLLEIAPETITWRDDDNSADYGAAMALEVKERLKHGIATLPITGGSTPLHLACQYGVSDETAHHLVQAAAAASEPVFTMCDSVGNTPLHIASTFVYNPHTHPSTMIELLLKESGEPKTIRNGLGFFPLRCLAAASTRAESKEERERVQACLEAYIESFQTDKNGEQIIYPDRRDLDYRFFVILGKQAPEWFIEHAGLQKKVQERMNRIFSSLRFTGRILFRLACFFFILVGMHFNWIVDAQEAALLMNEHKLTTKQIDTNQDMQEILHSASYFSYTNWIIYALMVLGFVGIWIERWIMFSYWTSRGQYFDRIRKHPSELMSTMVLLAGIAYAPLHWTHLDPHLWLEVLQHITAFVVLFAWCGVIVLLRLISLSFAEITDGAASAGKKITAFMVAFTILLVAFAQMFNIAAQGTGHEPCKAPDFCTFGGSLINTYTFAAGQVDDNAVPQTFLGLFTYVLFVYVVVIIITNVLAFILGSDILNRKNTAVWFWSMRIYYIAELDEIDQTIDKKMRCKNNCFNRYDTRMMGLWDSLTSIFKDKYLGGVMTCSFWMVMILRFIAFLIIIIWVVVGLLLFGIVWPPQVRRLMMESGSHSARKKLMETVTSQEDYEDEEEEDQGEEIPNEELGRLQDKVVQLEEKIDKMGDKLEQVLHLLKKIDKGKS